MCYQKPLNDKINKMEMCLVLLNGGKPIKKQKEKKARQAKEKNEPEKKQRRMSLQVRPRPASNKETKQVKVFDTLCEKVDLDYRTYDLLKVETRETTLLRL